MPLMSRRTAQTTASQLITNFAAAKPMRFLAFIQLIVLVTCAAQAQAMTLEAQGNLLFATGPVDDDLPKFEAAFATGKINTVVFVNSPGGDLWNGLRVGRLIASKGYQTVAAGSCVSACSIMFMGGIERRFSDAFKPHQTHIGIHGAANKNTREVSGNVQSGIYAFYKLNMGEKFNHSVINPALNEMEDAGAMLWVLENTRNPKAVPYRCKSGQSLRKDCTDITGYDALSLGIITHTDLVKLDLPAAFKPANTIMGQALNQVVPDMAAYLTDLANRQCISEACKPDIAKFIERPEHRATASAIAGKGVGWTWGADSPTVALLRAVYFCNHPKDKPVRLCEVEMVDTYDLRPLQRSNEAEHKTMLAKLTLPTEKFYANEEFGGGFTSAKGLRTEKFTDITPQKLDGMATLGTQGLVQALLSAQPPVVIDVSGSVAAIPSSLPLPYGGYALADANLDAAFEKRFEGLLKLLVPQTSTPVVFTCLGRNSWLSVNAALRAKKLGYTQVAWYRGGAESWKAASLPTALPIIRAIAQ